jgi:HlyD family secretion protein
MTATVDIITNRKDNIIGVPISAIVIKNDTTAGKNQDQKYEAVFLKEGEKAELRKVTTGIQDDSNIEITEGLEEGETVITGPYNTVTKSLKEGDDVEVTNK